MAESLGREIDEICVDMQNNVTIKPLQSGQERYAAPEVIAGQAPGPHSDIYSMGVILFEMVTGTVDGLGEMHPAGIRNDIPQWLDDMIIKCSKRDRRDRYLNAEEVLSDLVRLKSASRPEEQGRAG